MNADKMIEQAVTEFTARGLPSREVWKRAAAYCRRHDIEVLRADHENRTLDHWRAVTSRDVANRHAHTFRVRGQR